MKIIDIERELSSSNPDFGARYLILDSVPHQNWINLFEATHRQTFDMMKRAIRIQGNYLIVECPMQELQYQIKSLNELCSKTDSSLQAIQEREKQEREESQLRAEAEQKKANDSYDKLKFD
ncbi:hypothetical protein ABKV41_16345 (plasmid) [Enterobacter roggenkampii]|uniref:hypothetical protein n=1 Tax=Enterobacter roggenkampii TaxID=1812935 RepID=UPI0032AFA0B2